MDNPQTVSPDSSMPGLPLEDQIAQLTTAPADPPVEPAPEATTPEAASPETATETAPETTDPEVKEPETTQQESAPELEDDEEFRLSWEEPDETAPAEKAQTPEKLTAEGLEEIRSYITEQLKLDDADSDKLWGRLLQLPRARKSLEAYKTLRDLEKPWDEGGVGYIPDTGEIRQLVNTRLAFHDLLGDLTSGDPAKSTDALSFIFAPSGEDGTPQLRPGIEQALPHLPATLFRAGGPPLYNTVAKPILENFMNMLYEEGEKSDDKDQREWATNTARGIDWRLNKTWRKSAATNGSTEHRSSERPADPQLTEQLRQRDERIRELEGSKLQSFRSSVESEESTIISQGLDEALAVAKSLYPERVFAAVRDDFARQVRTSIQNDPVFQREYNELLSRSYKTGSPADRSQLTIKFRQKAGTAIKRFRTHFLNSIKSTTAERRTEAEKDRQALSQVQNKVGPTSNGQTAHQQVSAPDQERPAGMSRQDWLQSRISQITGSVAVQ